MTLTSNHTDLHLETTNGESFEYYWLDATGSTNQAMVLSFCPQNFPSVTILTMSNKRAVIEAKGLLKEGWCLRKVSEKWSKLAYKYKRRKKKI